MSRSNRDGVALTLRRRQIETWRAHRDAFTAFDRTPTRNHGEAVVATFEAYLETDPSLPPLSRLRVLRQRRRLVEMRLRALGLAGNVETFPAVPELHRARAARAR